MNYLDKIDTILNEYVVNEASTEYDKLFKELMDKWDIKSPDELKERDRKKFFQEVEKKWKEMK